MIESHPFFVFLHHEKDFLIFTIYYHDAGVGIISRPLAMV